MDGEEPCWRAAAPASSEPPVGTVRAQNLCGMDPLVAVPHTSMCMGVDSFTERTQSIGT
jgi:hypothetical protein